MSPHPSEWESTIGLEIHVQLNTHAKIFSRSPNRFGEEPNTNIDAVDTGQPGALPVLNRGVIEKAIRFGCAIGARVATLSTFARKSYFYPDSPRNFQITQFENPIIQGGRLIANIEGEEKTFPIHHAHLEDDAGMLKHFPDFAGIDFNRAGIPLLEIVSEPCISSPTEAVAYATALKRLLQYLDISDCDMEKGSFRIDTNVSIRPKGEGALRNKVEIKNLNSFHSMEVGISAEIDRQIGAYTANPETPPHLAVLPATVRFDVEKKRTVPMRSKEEAKDYRYFPEPDLPPIRITATQIASIRENLPELPHERLARYTRDLHLSSYNASILIGDKRLSDYFESALALTPNAQSICNWITIEFAGRLKERGIPLYRSGIPSRDIARLVALIDHKAITGRIAKEIADEMVGAPGKSPDAIIEENPHFQALHDREAIATLIEEALQQNPQSIEEFKRGKEKAFHFLVGQIMRLSKGQASPDIVRDLLTQRLTHRDEQK